MKILLTATVQSHICQFHRPLVDILHEQGYEVHVAARDNLAEKNGLKLDFADKVFNIPFSRSPKSADNIKAYKQLKRIIKRSQKIPSWKTSLSSFLKSSCCLSFVLNLDVLNPPLLCLFPFLELGLPFFIR